MSSSSTPPTSSSIRAEDNLLNGRTASDSRFTRGSRKRELVGAGEEETQTAKRMHLSAVRPRKSNQSVAERLVENNSKKEAAAKSLLSTPIGTPNECSALSPSSVHSQVQRKPPKKKRRPFDDKQKTTLRMIGQFLNDLGLRSAVRALVRESAVKMERKVASQLREAVMKGYWNAAILLSNYCARVGWITFPQYIQVRQFIGKQWFLDLMYNDKEEEAMRAICTQEFFFDDETKALFLEILYMDDVDDIGEFQKYCDYRNEQRGSETCCCDETMRELYGIFSPNFMMPTANLDVIIRENWRSGAAANGTTSDTGFSLFPHPNFAIEDKEEVTSFHATTIARDHHDEVWVVKFSPCGRFLATASFASCIIIWRVVPKGRKVENQMKLYLRDRESGAGCLVWSHDSALVAVIGTDDHPYMVQMNMRNYGTDPQLYIYEVAKKNDKIFARIPSNAEHSFSSCTFFPNPENACGYYTIAIGDLRGKLTIWSLTKDRSEPQHCFDGYRILACHALSNRMDVIAADTHNRVRVYRNAYNGDVNDGETLFSEDSEIVTMLVHPSERYVLLTCKMAALRLWDLDTNTLYRTFNGAEHGDFVIHSTFGGPNNEFLATGTHDGRIVIWNIYDSDPLIVVDGHKGPVNCVSWHPTDPFLIASGSDDRTVRLWSSREEDPEADEDRTETGSESSYRANWFELRHSTEEDDDEDYLTEREKRDIERRRRYRRRYSWEQEQLSREKKRLEEEMEEDEAEGDFSDQYGDSDYTDDEDFARGLAKMFYGEDVGDGTVIKREEEGDEGDDLSDDSLEEEVKGKEGEEDIRHVDHKYDNNLDDEEDDIVVDEEEPPYEGARRWMREDDENEDVDVEVLEENERDEVVEEVYGDDDEEDELGGEGRGLRRSDSSSRRSGNDSSSASDGPASHTRSRTQPR